MDVIAVIDVRHGVAVRAVAGDRANYRPLASPFSASSDPRAVAQGLMALHPFAVIYVADLDGIEGRGADTTLLKLLAADHPGAEVWADQGAKSADEIAAALACPGVSAVIGSETGAGPEELAALKGRFGDRVILSLDFRGDGFVGDPALLANPACWPKRVIAMTLARVGRGAGPDLMRIGDLKRRSPASVVYAAGGVRNRADLVSARSAGASGALIASALHAQTLTAGELHEITGR